MELVVNIKTVASHNKEYKSIEFTDWNPYVIEIYVVGESIPADSIFLCQDGKGLLFKIPRPKPRSLPVLDSEIVNKVSLYFKPEVVTLSKFTADLELFICDNIFTTNAEISWWNKYREFDIEMGEKLITINIVGK